LFPPNSLARQGSHSRAEAFPANKDIYSFALDAVTSFAFGQQFEYSAVRSAIDALEAIDKRSQKTLALGDQNDPVKFPQPQLSELLAAITTLTDTVMELHGNPLPALTWAYVMRKPRVAKANRIKEDYIKSKLSAAAAEIDQGHDAISAVEHMVARENTLAEKNERKPEYLSRVMVDEVFGFVYAGHETTSTTLCWGVKNLADNREAQSQLRTALRNTHGTAHSGGRSPTAHEIVSTQVPWLEATIEEMLRCSSTAPSVDRMSLRDTQLLGYQIPKGTIVSHPCAGPSLTRPGFEIDEAQRSSSSRDARSKHGVGRNVWSSSDVAKFKPERWLKQQNKGGHVEFDPNAGPQLAFGLGTRGCWGKRLVYVEARILITLLVWHFEFLPCPPALSGYDAVMKATNEPRDCYVCLRELN
jgi:cytochrome P450